MLLGGYQNAMDEVIKLMEIFPWLLSHDNAQIPFQVFSQHLNNQGEFGNGTAATVYLKHGAALLSHSANEDLKRTQAAGLQNPLTKLDILDLADQSYPCIAKHMTHQILQFLLDSPEFNLKSYAHRDSKVLGRLAPVNQLPSGQDNITLNYLLGTVNIPEASYEDNDCLIEEFFHQIG